MTDPTITEADNNAAEEIFKKHFSCEALQGEVKDVSGEPYCGVCPHANGCAEERCFISSIIARHMAEEREALWKSVHLQSHYAALLNDYDGGERMQFSSASDWIVRLRETKEAAQ